MYAPRYERLLRRGSRKCKFSFRNGRLSDVLSGARQKVRERRFSLGALSISFHRRSVSAFEYRSLGYRRWRKRSGFNLRDPPYRPSASAKFSITHFRIPFRGNATDRSSIAHIIKQSIDSCVDALVKIRRTRDRDRNFVPRESRWCIAWRKEMNFF